MTSFFLVGTQHGRQNISPKQERKWAVCRIYGWQVYEEEELVRCYFSFIHEYTFASLSLIIIIVVACWNVILNFSDEVIHKKVAFQFHAFKNDMEELSAAQTIFSYFWRFYYVRFTYKKSMQIKLSTDAFNFFSENMNVTSSSSHAMPHFSKKFQAVPSTFQQSYWSRLLGLWELLTPRKPLGFSASSPTILRKNT